jgi:hypothetical protein
LNSAKRGRLKMVEDHLAAVERSIGGEKVPVRVHIFRIFWTNDLLQIGTHSKLVIAYEPS